MAAYGELHVKYNMSIPVMGTPMALSLNIRVSLRYYVLYLITTYCEKIGNTFR